MIIQPKIRGFICTTAHPVGCAAHVAEQIEYVQAQGSHYRRPQESVSDRRFNRLWLGLTHNRGFWVRRCDDGGVF